MGNLVGSFCQRFSGITRNLRKWRSFDYLWIKWRAWQQARQIRGEQALYDRIARASSIETLDEVQLKKELQRRLRQRGLFADPRPPGSIRTLYASEMSVWEPHQIPPALTRLGPNTVFSLNERGFFPKNPDWPARRPALDRELFLFVLAEHRKHPIEVFVSYLSGWHVSPETIRAIGELGIITCAFHWDDRLSFRGRRVGGRWSGPAALAPAYDLNLTNASASLIKYFAEGGLACFWPEGANPEHFRPLPGPFEHDVSFIGGCYGQRRGFIDYLRRGGVRVETFGPGWPRGPLPEPEMVAVYAKSRINLGFSGIGYSLKEHCLKGRDFEVPMCGALYLTSEQPDLHLVYEVGGEVLSYDGPGDCLEKIRYLLAHPDESAGIRQAARRRALREHTWEARFRKLFELLGVLSA